MNEKEYIEYINCLRHRIQELEEKVEQLRLSRRVLMNLIEKIEHEKNGILSKLEKENKKLSKSNYHYAKSILNKNRIIVELESKLSNITSLKNSSS